MRAFVRPLLAGLDGGSTKTRLIIADANGSILGHATGGPSNCGIVSPDRLAGNFENIFGAAARKVGTTSLDFVCIGSAGVSQPSDFSSLEAIMRQVASVKLGQLRVETDAMIGLVGGVGRTDGIVLIAGTGSVCFGQNPGGRTWQAGGRDHLVDDHGSAYGIALEGLVAAVRAADGRGPATALQDRFFKALGIGSLLEIIRRLHYPDSRQPVVDKTYLAGLAPHVFACARDGDAVAAAIIDSEINELVHMVDVVARKLEWPDEAVPLVLIGSVANHAEVRPILALKLQQLCPRLQIVRPILSPQGGALLLAAKLAGIEIGPEFVAHIKQGEEALSSS